MRECLSNLGKTLAVACLFFADGKEVQAQNATAQVWIQNATDEQPRRLEVSQKTDQRTQPREDAKLVGVVEVGAILINLGCAEFNRGFWCDVRPMRGGPRGFIEAAHVAPAKGPDGLVPFGKDRSKERARKKDFDATGEVLCAQEVGQSFGTCRAMVSRDFGGDATVAVMFPNGFVRYLYFMHGEFVRASSTMSGVGTDVDWKVEESTHKVRVDDQRYSIPDQLIFPAQN